MKKLITKNSAKGVVAILATLVCILFCGSGQQEFASDTFFYDDTYLISDTSETYEEEVVTEVTTTVTTPVVTTTTTTVTTTTSTITTAESTVISTTSTTQQEEIFYAFYEDSMRVHYSNCQYYDSSMVRIEGNYIDYARPCEACQPDIEIGELYVPEPVVQETSAPASSYESSGSYGLSDWDITLLRRIVSSEYGADWVPVEEKAKIVACVMNEVYDSRWPSTVQGCLEVTCCPYGFNMYGDYYMSDSIYAAVDYYFANQNTVFAGWTANGWSGDGWNNYWVTY